MKLIAKKTACRDEKLFTPTSGLLSDRCNELRLILFLYEVALYKWLRVIGLSRTHELHDQRERVSLDQCEAL